MVTILNNPPNVVNTPPPNDTNGLEILFGLILFIVLLFLIINIGSNFLRSVPSVP